MRSFSINLILSGGGGGGRGIGESDAALVGTAVLPRARELRTREPVVVAVVVDAPHCLLQSLSMLLLYFLLLRGGVEVLRAGLSCIIVALLFPGG